MNWPFYLFVTLFVLHEVIEFVLLALNQRHVSRHRDQIPDFYRERIDISNYARSIDYTLTKGRFAMVVNLLKIPVIWLAILSGAFGALDIGLAEWMGGISLHHSVVYCAMIGLILSIAGIPASVYSTFVIEQRFGFNKMTPKLFVIDYLKQLVLTALLGVPLLYLLFWLVREAGPWWWLYGFLSVFGVQFFIAAIYPTILAPIFNKFTPLAEGDLKQAILAIAKKIGFKLSGIFTIDGSRRSAHSNAYFAGMGRFRRIVLFDTLNQQLTNHEIVSVLAHEMGHNIKRHTQRHLVLALLITFIGFWGLGLLMDWLPFYQTFRAGAPAPHKALVLFALFAPYLTFVLTPMQNYLSRRYEYEADAFAKQALADSAGLSGALVKLTKENLSNLTPHPWYSFYHYSHPTTVERVTALQIITQGH